MILIIVNVIEKKFNFIRKIVFKVIKKNCIGKLKREKMILVFDQRLTYEKKVLNAFKAKNVRNTNKTFDLLGCSYSFPKLSIESQLYGEMNLENYGKVLCLDHCLANAFFNLLDEKEMKKCLNWINLRPK